MLKRVLALLTLPTAALLCVIFVRWRSVRDAPPAGYERYHSEGLFFLLLAPSVVIYLLALPLVWRIANRGIGPFNPTLADQAFFLVFPFLPVVVAVVLSLVLLPLPTSPDTTAPR